MAYVIYVAAALAADAKFPEFLRNHLFDGLAPAVLIGLIIDRFPAQNGAKAFPKIQPPAIVLLGFFAAGTVVFGAIAAAAVFSSGSNDFGGAVPFQVLVAASMFPVAYFLNVVDDVADSAGTGLGGAVKWFFKVHRDKTSAGAGGGDQGAGPETVQG